MELEEGGDKHEQSKHVVHEWDEARHVKYLDTDVI